MTDPDCTRAVPDLVRPKSGDRLSAVVLVAVLFVLTRSNPLAPLSEITALFVTLTTPVGGVPVTVTANWVEPLPPAPRLPTAY